MSKETEELVNAVANIGKYFLKLAVEASHKVENRVEPSSSGGPSEHCPHQSAQTDFHLGEWRRFTEFGEAYQVVSPIKHLGDDWLMRIQLKDGTHAEYLLSQIRKNPIARYPDAE